MIVDRRQFGQSQSARDSLSVSRLAAEHATLARKVNELDRAVVQMQAAVNSLIASAQAAMARNEQHDRESDQVIDVTPGVEFPQDDDEDPDTE